jgi:hypothetical protein
LFEKLLPLFLDAFEFFLLFHGLLLSQLLALEFTLLDIHLHAADHWIRFFTFLMDARLLPLESGLITTYHLSVLDKINGVVQHLEHFIGVPVFTCSRSIHSLRELSVLLALVHCGRL